MITKQLYNNSRVGRVRWRAPVELSHSAERLGGHELELVGGTQPTLVGFERQGDRRVHQGPNAPAEHGSIDKGPLSAVRLHEPRNNNWAKSFSEVVKQSKHGEG